MADIIDIARVMRNRSCAKNLGGTCKEILGTCVSVGCTVEHEDPQDIQSKVDNLQSKKCWNSVLYSSNMYLCAISYHEQSDITCNFLFLYCAVYSDDIYV